MHFSIIFPKYKTKFIILEEEKKNKIFSQIKKHIHSKIQLTKIKNYEKPTGKFNPPFNFPANCFNFHPSINNLFKLPI